MSPMNPMFTAPGGKQPQMLGRVSPPAPPPTNMNTIYGPDPKAPPIMAYGPGGQPPMPQTQPPAPPPQAPQLPVGGAPQGGMSPGRTALIRSVMARAGGPAGGGWVATSHLQEGPWHPLQSLHHAPHQCSSRQEVSP